MQMAASFTSNPWHPMFAFLNAPTAAIVQMHFHSTSPLDEHPANTWICIIGLLFYCLAFVYHERCQSCTPADTTSLNCCVKIAFISGSLAYTALLSLLLRRSLQPLAFIVWLMVLVIYFNHKKVAEMGKHMASYLCGLWRKRISNLYELWRITQSDR